MERIRPRNRLVEWAVAREKIRILKEQGLPPPWTDDPILQTYRFCNVRRRDDRVSRWIIQNVLSKFTSIDDVWVFIQLSSLCRWINWPPTLMEILEANLVTDNSLDYSTIADFIEVRRSMKEKAWTGAYIIRAPSKRGGYDGWTKSTFVTEIVVHKGLFSVKQQLTDALLTKRCEDVYKVLCSIPNWGTFMSGQVVADWTYCHLLWDASDRFTWAPMGPGSRRGYNRMCGQALTKAAPTQEVWNFQLQRWREEILDRLGPAYEETLTLHDVQNCLCEFDKYERVRLGEGRPRSRYVPEEAY